MTLSREIEMQTTTAEAVMLLGDVLFRLYLVLTQRILQGLGIFVLIGR